MKILIDNGHGESITSGLVLASSPVVKTFASIVQTIIKNEFTVFLRASDYPAIFRWEEVFNIRFIFDFVFIDGAVEFLIKPFQNTAS
jgi:hypothetical protein